MHRHSQGRDGGPGGWRLARGVHADPARVPGGEPRQPGWALSRTRGGSISVRVQQPGGVRVEPGEVDRDGGFAVDLERSVGGLADPRRGAGPRRDEKSGRMDRAVWKVARRDVEPPVGCGSWVGGQLFPQVQEGGRRAAHGDQVWGVRTGGQ